MLKRKQWAKKRYQIYALAHELRNEITASERYSTKRLHKQSWSHRLLAGDVVEVPSQYSNHECDEGRSRATSLESYISLRNSWDLARFIDKNAASIGGNDASHLSTLLWD